MRSGDLRGGGGTLLLHGQQDTIVSVDFGVGLSSVVGLEHVGHIGQANGADLPGGYGEQGHLLRFVHAGKEIPHLDRNRPAVLGKASRRHGEIVGRQQGVDGLHGDKTIHPGLLQSGTRNFR